MGLFGRKKSAAKTETKTAKPEPQANSGPMAAAAPAANVSVNAPQAGAAADALFAQLEPVSAARHGGLGVNRTAVDMGFLRRTRRAPVFAGEFPAAAASFPIVFAGEAREPQVVLGLRAGETLLLDPAGQLDPLIYVPAFLRRYPFFFAVNGETGAYGLCLDRAADVVVEAGGAPLFDGEAPAELTNTMLTLMADAEAQRRATQTAISALEAHGLFDAREFKAPGADGEPVTVARYTGVAMDKLGALSGDALADLQAKGALAVAYAHLVSLANWPRLLRVSARAASAAGRAA